MQTLFTSDRMIVDGEVREYNDMDKKSIFLYLQFTFQVNGKQTRYTIEIELEIKLKELEIISFDSWNAICDLFFSMGYRFNEGITPNYGIVKEWIDYIKSNQ